MIGRAINNMYLVALSPKQHAETCGYWYTIKAYGSMPHTAFATQNELNLWLKERGLTIAYLPKYTDHNAWVKIHGSYREASHMFAPAFYSLPNVVCTTRTLSNAEWVEALITLAPDGIRTVHTLNPNVRNRITFSRDPDEGA